MSKLYPIGTQLITRRLSQAALAYELGFQVETRVAFGAFYPGFDVGFNNFDQEYETWRVTVTEEDQKWLSSIPMEGDLVDVDRRYSIPTTIYVSKYDVGLLGNPKAVVNRIIERTYPNGQRAPLIKWDEVIEPEVEERK